VLRWDGSIDEDFTGDAFFPQVTIGLAKDLPAGQWGRGSSANFFLCRGATFDFPTFSFGHGHWLKLGFRLPVRIQFTQEVNEYGSSDNWDCQSQKQTCKDGQKRDDCFHTASFPEPRVCFAAADPLTDGDQQTGRKDNPDQ
jgi:hypothetical protein